MRLVIYKLHVLATTPMRNVGPEAQDKNIFVICTYVRVHMKNWKHAEWASTENAP